MPLRLGHDLVDYLRGRPAAWHRGWEARKAGIGMEENPFRDRPISEDYQWIGGYEARVWAEGAAGSDRRDSN